jgi:hypothetical protein
MGNPRNPSTQVGTLAASRGAWLHDRASTLRTRHGDDWGGKKLARLYEAEITGNRAEIRPGLVFLFADCLEGKDVAGEDGLTEDRNYLRPPLRGLRTHKKVSGSNLLSTNASMRTSANGRLDIPRWSNTEKQSAVF